MKKLLLAILTSSLFIIAPAAHAEHSIGFAAGSTRGVGATYRFLPDPGSESSLGWQVTGLPIVTKEGGMISGGAAVLWLLHRGNVGLAYASLGFGAISGWSTCTDEGYLHCEEESHWGMGVGPGIGFELRLVENFGFSVDVPLAILFADGEFEGIYPVPNSSLVYYW
jgi:hypothetical protein